MLSGKGNIGVLPITGVILDSTKALKELKALEENDDIKGVIVRINSPGGAVAPSQEIYDAVKRLRKTKPVIASFDSVAASGGYYIAVGAEKIITNPGSMTGSIGVIMDFVNLAELYKWAKVDRFNIKSGKFKDIGTENRPMTADEKAVMQGMILNVYEQFVTAVAEGRKMPKEKVKELADGRAYTGDQAVKLGLADKLGGMDFAVETMKEMAKIKGKPELVYPDEKRNRFLEVFTESIANGIIRGVANGLGLQLNDANQSQLSTHGNGKMLFFL